MASSSDVRDIFSLPAPGSGASSSRRAAPARRGPPTAPGASGSGKAAAGAKKPDGLTRELYALLGDSVPSLAIARAEFEDAQAAKARLKPKFKKRPMKAKQWCVALWQAEQVM
jgi:DNA methyltransferase 1-associated protein 1